MNNEKVNSKKMSNTKANVCKLLLVATCINVSSMTCFSLMSFSE